MSTRNAVLSALFLSGVLASCYYDPEPSAVVEQHPTVVLLTDDHGGMGSGTVIAPDWVLTCAHCAPMTRAGDFEVTNTYIAPGGNVDMALMRAPGITADHYPLVAVDNLKMYDDLSVYGWHLGRFLLQTDGHKGADDSMSAPAIGGCSGGAVVNDRGELIGVMEWVFWTSTATGQDGFALPHMSGYTSITGELLAWIKTTLK